MQVNFRLSKGFVNAASVREGLSAFAVSLGMIVTLQVLGGAYASGFGGDADEPAHLVTSLMVRDFIAGLDFRHPWQFAQQYYYHYPKVAIGHWPPVFYGALGTWLFIIGVSRATAIMFIAIVAATTASVIYFTGKRLIGRSAGVLAAVLFVASPLVQESSAQVMTEHLVTLGMLVSTLCFARFARTGQIRDGLAFGIIAGIAILTHGSAWALGLVPGVTLALTNRWDLLRRLGLWLAAVPVLVACVPWYVLTFGMVEGTWYGTSFWLQAPNFGWSIYSALGFTILVFAFIGLGTTFIGVDRRTEVVPEWAALAGLAMATFALHCILPTGAENRFMVTVVPPIVLFSAAGVNAVAQWVGGRLPIGVVKVILAVALIAAFGLESFVLPQKLRNGGYDALVRDVRTRVSNVPQVWLISSGANGEGRLVAAVAIQEPHPNTYVLRGKTILAGGDWFGRNQEDRFDTLTKLAELLDGIPVTIIVIDDRVLPEQRRPYHDRLRKLVSSEGEKWELIGSYPETEDAIEFPNSLHVYARRPIASLTTAPPATRLDRLKALMVRKELR
jgi:hypothetical protein